MYISIEELKTERDFQFAVKELKRLAETNLKNPIVKIKAKKACKQYLVVLVYPRPHSWGHISKVPLDVDIKCVSKKQLNFLVENLRKSNKAKLVDRLSYLNKILWKNKTTLKKLKSSHIDFLYKEQQRVLRQADDLNKQIIEHQMYCYEGPYINEIEAEDEKLKHIA